MKTKKISLGALEDSNKGILLEILEREGVETATVSFNGSGDDGQVEESDLSPKIKKIVVVGSKIRQGTMWDGGKAITRWKHDCTVEEIIQSICYEALEVTHGGWENEDGAYGEIVFHVKDGIVKMDFNERVVQTELHEHEF